MTAPASPSDQLVLDEDDGPVRVLSLNRPTRLNSFTAASYRRLTELLNAADEDADVLVVVLRGEGRAFCSGVDLEELSREGGRQLGATFDALIDALLKFGKPLVAAVHGPAVGFGATILLHCDAVLVADDARLRFPFTSLGTAPEAGSSMLLPATVGPQRAAELLFTSRWIDAPEAVRYGLALSSWPRGRTRCGSGRIGHAHRTAAARFRGGGQAFVAVESGGAGPGRQCAAKGRRPAG